MPVSDTLSAAGWWLLENATCSSSSKVTTGILIRQVLISLL